ncbi:MAG: SUMF1/EgtB/PvdO family nonheme iron enzyme [Chloroflexota bacterium]
MVKKFTLSPMTIIILLSMVTACTLPFLGGAGPATPEEGGVTAPGTGGVVPVASGPGAPTNTDGAETIFIPGGTFWMGSDESDTEADVDEMPRHKVTLDGFYIYTHEVTNEMYAACVAAGACMPVHALENGPTTHYGDPASSDHPVVGVDWVMARDYCSWAGGRLPTEAEWEMAARSLEGFRYPWGEDEPTCDHVNMFGCSMPPDTQTVGTFALGNSPYGGWDMAGNVWEWVYDWYAPNYYTFSPKVNPLGPGIYQDEDNPLKVVRGGGLYSQSEQMRAATRLGANPYRPYDDVGFRCVPMGGLALPENYVDAGDGHERVPPEGVDEGGERVEDPIPGLCVDWIGWRAVSCPTPEGLIRLAVETVGGYPDTYTLSVGGEPFDCHYNDPLDVLACEGPASSLEGIPWPWVVFELCWENECGHHCEWFTAVRPEDCDERETEPSRLGLSVDCPRDGLFSITFEFEPPVTWDIVRIVTPDVSVDLPCVELSETSLRCTAPDLPAAPDHYEFYLHGTDAEGTEFETRPWAPVRDDCPVDVLPDERHTVETICWEDDTPAVQINHAPDAVLENITIDGAPAVCIGMAPGVQICALPDPAGVERAVEFCFVGGHCYGVLVTAPDCPLIDVGPEEPVCEMAPVCWPPDAAAVDVLCWPADVEFSYAESGIVLPCEDWGGGRYVCTGVPGTAGDLREITACLADGRCFYKTITIPACGAPPTDVWNLTHVGCSRREGCYEVLVDTYIEWLTSLDLIEGYHIFYDDHGLLCELHPTIPGRFYCIACDLPDDPGPLEACLWLERPDEPTCATFTDFAVRIPATCEEAPPEEEEPPPLTCSDYTTMDTCQAHGCVWTKGPPDGLEHCYEPPGP